MGSYLGMAPRLSRRLPTCFVEFVVPAPTVAYIETFTTQPVVEVAKNFLADTLAEEVPLLLPVPSCVVISCFCVQVTDAVTVIFSVSASQSVEAQLEILFPELINCWIAHLSLLRAPNLPLVDPPPLDVDLLELSSLIILPTEEHHFSTVSYGRGVSGKPV